MIPNSVLNKTALTRRAPASGSLCEMGIVVAHGSDLDTVRADILSAASEMSDLLRADCEPYARFVGSDAYGIQCVIGLYLADGVAPTLGEDALMSRTSACDWIARAA